MGVLAGGRGRRGDCRGKKKGGCLGEDKEKYGGYWLGRRKKGGLARGRKREILAWGEEEEKENSLGKTEKGRREYWVPSCGSLFVHTSARERKLWGPDTTIQHISILRNFLKKFKITKKKVDKINYKA